jgi:hypothetical protein
MTLKTLHRRAGLRLLAIGAAVALVAVALAATTASGGYPATTAANEGISYGGLSKDESLWLRLTPDRGRIDALEFSWSVPRSNCSNKKRYGSSTGLGEEWGRRTPVVQGSFSRRAVDRYRLRGVSYVEDFKVTGTVSAEQVSGEFKVKVTAKKGKRTRFTCKYGPVAYNLEN